MPKVKITHISDLDANGAVEVAFSLIADSDQILYENLRVQGAQPSPIMFEQLGDAAAVWAVDTSTLTTAGTTGELVVRTEQKVDDNQALIIAK